MSKTFKDNNREKGFSKPKSKAKNTKTPKEKRQNKSFDYSSSDFD